MLKQFIKSSLFVLCFFATFSAFAWHCTATNARHNGIWVGDTPYDGPTALQNAQQFALNACENAARTINPETCHIVACYQN